MTEPSELLELAGVRYYQSDADPDTFYFLPGTPEPERDPRGRPALTLWVSGDTARLQFGSRWGVAPERLAAFKRELALRHPKLSPALIRLQPASLGTVTAELAMGDGRSAPTPIATVSSSGFMPYTALFNTALDAEQKDQALATLNGRSGFMSLTYKGAMASSVMVTVTISGDATEDVEALPERPSAEACLAQVVDALEEGRLTLTRSGGAGAPPELWQHAEDQVMVRAAAELHRLYTDTSRPGRASVLRSTEARLHAEVSLSAPIELPITASVDLADWFAGSDGTTHIRVMPGNQNGMPTSPATGTEPRPATAGAVRVSLAFTPTELPVAFVELRRGAWRATLRGPTFAAIELPAGTAGPLEVITNYTTGAPYSVKLEAPGTADWALIPADLGLAEVVVDATARREAGAREVRLRLRYKAAGAGTDDDHTIYLRRETWTARWFLITRAPTIDGALELEWRELDARGAPTWHRPAPIETTTITL